MLFRSDTAGAKLNVGERNITAGWSLIEQHGYTLQEVDVGDCIPRTVTLCLRSGKVEVRRGAHREPPKPTLGARG